MKTNHLIITCALLVVVLAITLVPFQTAHADLGPKSSMHFEFAYEINPPPTIISGIQLECHTADCSDAEPLGQIGAQGFGCRPQECSSHAYGYTEYHRLSIEFSDGKTRQSNVFEKKYFEAYYRVTVRENDLQIQELPGKRQPISFFTVLALLSGTFLFCVVTIIYLPVLVILFVLLNRNKDFNAARGWYIAAWVVCLLGVILSFLYDWGLSLTLIVEGIVSLVYALWRKRPCTKLLTVVLMLNLVTQPVLWTTLRNFTGNSFWPLAIGEVIVWLVEAGILALALRKQTTFWEALALSLVLNLSSFGVGLLLPF